MNKRDDLIQTYYLIIGNSAGGIGAVEAIREVDKKGTVTVVSEETYQAYSRPLISEYLSNERNIDNMLLRPTDFHVKHDVDLILGKKVVQLNPEQGVVHLDNGVRLSWEKLLLATGGMPILPPLIGNNKDGVFTFLNLDDSIRIANFIKEGQHAVVIGGGLIGISVTEALIKRGVAVTVIEMKDRILNTILDNDASSIAEATLKNAGVKIITNHTVSLIDGHASVEGVVIDNNERISCDLVIIAIGVLPRTDLTSGTEIKVNRGIIVDRYMQTSYPNIYACGDAAEIYDFIYGTNRVIPIWPNAYMGGRTAGYNMGGVSTVYSGITNMNSINYFGLDITAAGMVSVPDNGPYEIMSQRRDSNYKKLILRNNVIVGMIFIGDIERSGIMFGLMRDQINVELFKQDLMGDNFGLACIPSAILDSHLGILSMNKRNINSTTNQVK